MELAATAPGHQKKKIYLAIRPRVRARFDDEEMAVRLTDEVMKMDNSAILELVGSPGRFTETLRTLHGRQRDGGGGEVAPDRVSLLRLGSIRR